MRTHRKEYATRVLVVVMMRREGIDLNIGHFRIIV